MYWSTSNRGISRTELRCGVIIESRGIQKALTCGRRTRWHWGCRFGIGVHIPTWCNWPSRSSFRRHALYLIRESGVTEVFVHKGHCSHQIDCYPLYADAFGTVESETVTIYLVEKETQGRLDWNLTP